MSEWIGRKYNTSVQQNTIWQVKIHTFLKHTLIWMNLISIIILNTRSQLQHVTCSMTLLMSNILKANLQD